jgi:hypothetical protein
MLARLPVHGLQLGELEPNWSHENYSIQARQGQQKCQACCVLLQQFPYVKYLNKIKLR